MAEHVRSNASAVPSDILLEREQSDDDETLVVESDPDETVDEGAQSDPDETVDEGALYVVHPFVKKLEKKPHEKTEEKHKNKPEKKQGRIDDSITEEESALGHIAPLGPYTFPRPDPGASLGTINGGIAFKDHDEYMYRSKHLQSKIAARVRAQLEESQTSRALKKKLTKQSHKFRVHNALRDVLSENDWPGRSEAILLDRKHISKTTATRINKGLPANVVRRTATSELPILFDSWVPFQIDLVASTDGRFRIKFSDDGGRERELLPEIPEHPWPAVPSFYDDYEAPDTESEGTEQEGGTERPAKRRRTDEGAGEVTEENVDSPQPSAPRVKSRSAWKAINVDDEGYVNVVTWTREPPDPTSPPSRARAVRLTRSPSTPPRSSGASTSSHGGGDHHISPLGPWVLDSINESLVRGRERGNR